MSVLIGNTCAKALFTMIIPCSVSFVVLNVVAFPLVSSFVNEVIPFLLFVRLRSNCALIPSFSCSSIDEKNAFCCASFVSPNATR